MSKQLATITVTVAETDYTCEGFEIVTTQIPQIIGSRPERNLVLHGVNRIDGTPITPTALRFVGIPEFTPTPEFVEIKEDQQP